MSHEVKGTRQGNLVSQQNITKEIFLFRNHADNMSGRLVPVLFLFNKKALYEVNAIVLGLSFNISQYPSTCHTIKTNCIKF